MKTALYRAFNDKGVLLYVGISRDWPARWAVHRREGRFYDEVAWLRIDWLESKDAALYAEADSIRIERPLWNIVHANPDALDPKQSRGGP